MAQTRPTEFELIAKYFAPLCAPNAFSLLDDAAVITPPNGCDLVITKDMLVSNRHFFDSDPPEAIAAKALRVNLSDLAAKGATPLGFLLGIALPANWEPEWLERFATGLGKDIATYNCQLYGGDTVCALDDLVISITAFGTVPKGKIVRRTTMRAGDSLYVSGTIGDSALGLKMRLATEQWVSDFKQHQPKDNIEYFLKRYLLPEPRVELNAAVLEYASACMDISDGFVGDLVKMLGTNNLKLDLSATRIPMSEAARNAMLIEPETAKTVFTGGDDYELLIAVSPNNTHAFERAVAKTKTAVTYLGTAEQSESVSLKILDATGNPIQFVNKSYAHF